MVRKSRFDGIRRGSPALALVWFLAMAWLPRPASAQEDCYDNTFCLEGVSDPDGHIGIRIRNLLPGSITMRLGLEMENLSAGSPLPLVVSIPGSRIVQPLRLSVVDEQQRWSYRFNAEWILGALGVEHDDNFGYELPFDRGGSWLVGQGYLGLTTHQGKYALDFDVPEDTPVRAAREGTVIETEDRFRRGGPDPALKTQANFVKVQHADGTIANYVHLKRGGVRVRPGDRIKAGDLLGYSGNTGFTTGPHLHFEVFGINQELARDTLPVYFLTSEGKLRLQEGFRYSHPATRGW